MLIWRRIDVVAFEGEKVRWRARGGGDFHYDFYFSFNLSLHEFLNRESQTNGGGVWSKWEVRREKESEWEIS
jgi:hypothetical protein